MIRVLQLPDSIEKRNGRMSVIMNVYRKIDRSKIQFDFACTDYGFENYKEEIQELGGKVYMLAERKSNLANIRKISNKVLTNNSYTFVHYHALSKWGCVLSLAHKYKIKTIVHSHSTKMSDSFIKSIRNRIFSLNIFNADKKVAVSPEAGKELFLWHNFVYIPNMVNYSKFTYSEYKRELLRHRYNINSDEKVIGMVGRIAKQKNQLFALKVLKLLLKEKANVKLMFIGDYNSKEKSYYQSVKEYIVKNHLSEHVIFTGMVNNLGKYYSAFDILWLPSLYEGMPTVGIEAQANGLPVLASSTITKSMKVINDVEYLNIKKEVELWVRFTKKMIIKNREFNVIDKFNQSLFNEDTIVSKWIKLYS